MKKILTIFIVIAYANNSISAKITSKNSSKSKEKIENKTQFSPVKMPNNLCKMLVNPFKMPVNPLKIPTNRCTIPKIPCKNPFSPCNSAGIQGGEAILAVGKKMVFGTKEIIKGGCWDYVDVVYTRAGYPRDKRQTIFKEAIESGPYADPEILRPGDWLYHVNHSYHGIGHSGIFIRWVDKDKHIAEMLSYAGESRNEPGRYRNYDLSNVYNIMRGK